MAGSRVETLPWIGVLYGHERGGLENRGTVLMPPLPSVLDSRNSIKRENGAFLRGF